MYKKNHEKEVLDMVCGNYWLNQFMLIINLFRKDLIEKSIISLSTKDTALGSMIELSHTIS